MQSPIPAVKERPILFSAAMVRAILDERKTQTRRIIKPQPTYSDVAGLFASWQFKRSAKARETVLWPNGKARVLEMCPYGKPGDRLWVRETWSGDYNYRDTAPSERDTLDFGSGNFVFKEEIWYWADGNPAGGDWEKPRPSIHMPRWASRILLEVVGVRVERLHDISRQDAEAEGALFCGLKYVPNETHNIEVDAFKGIWQSINGTNPWVWVVEFKRVTA